MSLIQEALKRKREEEALLPKKMQVAPVASNDSKRAPSNQTLLILLALVLLFLIGLTLLKLPREPVQVATTVQPATAQPLVPHRPSPPEPNPADPSPAEAKVKSDTGWPNLQLTGFAAVGKKNMVVINKKMFSAGSLVQGVRVEEVGEETVLLEYNGERRTLRAGEQ